MRRRSLGRICRTDRTLRGLSAHAGSCGHDSSISRSTKCDCLFLRLEVDLEGWYDVCFVGRVLLEKLMSWWKDIQGEHEECRKA